jgi:metallo-beta-lactamase family protein
LTTELISWGAAQEVTGSKHFLSSNNTTVMVDCGAFQGKRDESDRKNREWPFDPHTISAAILTHAHYDHCGLLPLLVKKGFDKTIYSTPATRDLANLILLDSARIQSNDYAFLRKQSLYRSEITAREPLYGDSDVRDCIKHFITVAYHRPFSPVPGVEATFYDAGHILGSAMVVVDVQSEGRALRVGFSGDLGRPNLPIIRDPEVMPPLDYLVIESTYGNRLHETADTAMDKLADVINRTVDRGGRILIPAFAIERTQELIFFIHLLSDRNRIPKIPIYVDSPMAVNATGIFKAHEECFDDETRQAFLDHAENPFGFNELHYISSKEKSQELNDLRRPAVIISSSGMCESGRILHHLLHTIADNRNTILIVGYMAEHTLGRKILEQWPRVPIFGETHALNAEVGVINAFSGHADYNEIVVYVKKLDKTRLRKIFLVHGEKNAQTNLKGILEGDGYKVEIVKAGERYRLG